MQTQGPAGASRQGAARKVTRHAIAGTLGNEHLIHEAAPQPQKAGRPHD